MARQVRRYRLPRHHRAIAGQLSEPRAWVQGVLCDLRFVLDRFNADDFTVLAPPFLARRRGDPVWVGLRDQPDECIDQVENYDPEHLASSLGLDLEVVRRHPVVGTLGVLCELWELRGLDLDAWEAGDQQVRAQAERLAALTYTWLDLWDPEVDEYILSRVGLEWDFQQWLVADLGCLAAFDLPVELVGQEFKFKDGKKADVLCRATADSPLVRRGDLVVIENKAHMVHVEACDQLCGYMERAQAEVAAGDERVGTGSSSRTDGPWNCSSACTTRASPTSRCPRWATGTGCGGRPRK